MDHKAAVLLQKREQNYAKKGICSGLLAGATWGLDGVLMGIVLNLAPFCNNMNIITVTLVGACLHDGFAALWIFISNVISGKWRDYIRTLKTRPGKMIVVAAALGGPIGMSCNLLAIYFSGASYTAAITAAYPALGAVFGFIFLKEKITARTWSGIILAIIGSVIVGFVPPEHFRYPHFYLGIGLAVVAAMGWALEGVISTYGMDLVDSDIAISIRETASFFIYMFMVLPAFRLTGYKLILTCLFAKSGWYMAFIALIGAISFLSWYRSMSKIGVGRAMSLNVTFAIWSVFFSWLLNGLQITPNLIAGVVIIFLGTILTIGNPMDLVKIYSIK